MQAYLESLLSQELRPVVVTKRGEVIRGKVVDFEGFLNDWVQESVGGEGDPGGSLLVTGWQRVLSRWVREVSAKRDGALTSGSTGSYW